MDTQNVKSKYLSPSGRYSESFKKHVVREYERGFLNRSELRVKYGIGGHSVILGWCRKYGKLHYPERGFRGSPMKDPQKRRIQELERQLEDARLKVIAYERLIALAEQEEGISILKKGGAKQSVSLPEPTQEK